MVVVIEAANLPLIKVYVLQQSADNSLVDCLCNS